MSHSLFEPMVPEIQENPDYQVLLTSFNALRASFAKIHVENVCLRKQLASILPGHTTTQSIPLAQASVSHSELKNHKVHEFPSEPLSQNGGSVVEDRGDHDMTIIGETLPKGQAKPSKKSCNLCEKSFSRTSDLKRHVLSYHEGRKFPCSECGHVYSRKATMLEHLRSTHRNVREEIEVESS